MNVSRTELAEELGINEKTVRRLQGTVFIQVNPGERSPSFDLTSSVKAFTDYQHKVRRERIAGSTGAESSSGSGELPESVLRRWKSKVRITSQKITKLRDATVSFDDLTAAWSHNCESTRKLSDSWPARIADRLAGIEYISAAFEILRKDIYSLLEELATTDVPCDDSGEDTEEDIVAVLRTTPVGDDITDKIDREKAISNHLVAELNETTAELIAGKLIMLEAAERAMGDRVGAARSRLLSIPNGLARLVVGLEREEIACALREAIDEALAELRPIEAAEATNRDIVQDEDEDE